MCLRACSRVEDGYRTANPAVLDVRTGLYLTIRGTKTLAPRPVA